jgi:hypothetical protein
MNPIKFYPVAYDEVWDQIIHYNSAPLHPVIPYVMSLVTWPYLRLYKKTPVRPF